MEFNNLLFLGQVPFDLEFDAKQHRHSSKQPHLLYNMTRWKVPSGDTVDPHVK